MKPPIIYVDMDEVLSDFIGGACKAFNVTREEIEEHRENNEWTILPALTKATGIPFKPIEFWSVIHARGVEFWEDLEVLPWAASMVTYLDSLDIEWHIVSTPWGNEESEIGKRRWIKRFLGPAFDRLHLTKHKQLFSRVNTILIDDAPHNIENFTTKSPCPGEGILYPHPGNCLSHLANDPLTYVKIEVDKFVRAQDV
jgi:5'(3')-deoxyribonucleotidase